MANSLVKFVNGTQANYNALAAKDADTIYFCTDSQRLFLGTKEYTRPIVISATPPAVASVPKYSLYFNTEDGELFYTNGNSWNLIYSLSNITDELNAGIVSLSSSGQNINYSKRNGENLSMQHPAIYAVKGTQTAKTASWTGRIPITALYDGLCIAYYLPYNGSGDATLNLTLIGPDGTGTATTGAIPVYYASNTRATTHYGAGSTIFLTYWSAGSISVAGTATTADSWRSFDYYYNTNNAVTQNIRNNDEEYAVLFSAYSVGSTTTSATSVYRNDSVYINPSTGIITANGFNGALGHTLTIGSYSFNGSQDVTIPIYDGTIVNS